MRTCSSQLLYSRRIQQLISLSRHEESPFCDEFSIIVLSLQVYSHLTTHNQLLYIRVSTGVIVRVNAPGDWATFSSPQPLALTLFKPVKRGIWLMTLYVLSFNDVEEAAMFSAKLM